MLGSPVNRIRITGEWASRSLTTNSGLTLKQRLREYVGYVAFLSVMWSIDFVFYATRIRQWASLRLGWTTSSFEDELEKTMKGFAKSNFGVEIGDTAFEG